MKSQLVGAAALIVLLGASGCSKPKTDTATMTETTTTAPAVDATVPADTSATANTVTAPVVGEAAPAAPATTDGGVLHNNDPTKQ